MEPTTIDLEPVVLSEPPASEAGRATGADAARAAARMRDLQSMMDELLGTIDLAMIRNSGGE